VRFEKGDFHDGPGWYFWYEDYPDEGSVGAFATRKEAYDYAKACEDPPSVTDGCEVCGQFPYLSETGMCGPCTFGTADAIGEGDVYA
jgi:hypothetical protein